MVLAFSRRLLPSRPEPADMDTEIWQRIQDRPQAVRAHREAILDATSDAVAEAMPGPNASTYEYRQFCNSHAGVVTRQINDTEPGSDPHDEHDDTEVAV